MAQLNDTMVQGDLRVTGSIFNKLSDFDTETTGATGRIPLYIDGHNKLVSSMDTIRYLQLRYDYISGDTTLVNSGNKILALATASPSDGDLLVYKSGETQDYGYMEAKSIVSAGGEPLLIGSRGVQKSISATDGAWPGQTSSTGADDGHILGFNCTAATSVFDNQGIGIAFSGTYGGGLTYNSSYILGTTSNPDFAGVSDRGYDSTSYFFNGCSKSTIKAKYAAMALSGGEIDNRINDKMNKSGSNADAPTDSGTGATATLLNNLTSTGLGDITSGDACIPTTYSDGTNTSKWYKRPLSKLWPWIKGKLTSDSGVNISGNAATVTNYSPRSSTRIWGQPVGTDKILDIALENNAYDTTFIIMFSTSSSKWPSIISVACRYTGTSSWAGPPKVALIYNTSASADTSKPLIKQYISDGKGHILLQPIVSRTTETQCTIIAASGDVSKLTVTAVENTNTLWTSASAITSIEQNVSKTDVGTAIGSINRPVYVRSSGFVEECSEVHSDKIYDWHSGTYMKLYVGGLGTDGDTIYIQ